MEYMLGIEFDGDNEEDIAKKINQLNSKITEDTDLAFKTEIAKTDAELLNYWTIRKST